MPQLLSTPVGKLNSTPYASARVSNQQQATYRRNPFILGSMPVEVWNRRSCAPPRDIPLSMPSHVRFGSPLLPSMTQYRMTSRSSRNIFLKGFRRIAHGTMCSLLIIAMRRNSGKSSSIPWRSRSPSTLLSLTSLSWG